MPRPVPIHAMRQIMTSLYLLIYFLQKFMEQGLDYFNVSPSNWKAMGACSFDSKFHRLVKHISAFRPGFNPPCWYSLLPSSAPASTQLS